MEENSTQNKEQDKKAIVKDNFIRALAVIGLIVGLYFGTVFMIKYSPTVFEKVIANVVSITSKLFSRDRDIIEVYSDKYNVRSAEAFTINWENKKKGDDSYFISYPCIQDLHIEIITIDSDNVVVCNEREELNISSNQLTLAAFSNSEFDIDLPISISYGKDETSALRGEVLVTVGNKVSSVDNSLSESTAVTSNNPIAGATTVNRQPGKKTENLFEIKVDPIKPPNKVGPVDLAPRIIATGFISTTTNEFTSSSKVNPKERIAVKFEVENIGDAVSPEWTFNAVLPTFPSHIYHSPSQIALAPGDRIEYVIGFDSVLLQSQVEAIINVDPISSVRESNETNNIVKAKIILDL